MWTASLSGERRPSVFLQTPYDESSGAFSPDGHWIAYESNESGRYEVYVRPFPEGKDCPISLTEDGRRDGAVTGWSSIS